MFFIQIVGRDGKAVTVNLENVVYITDYAIGLLSTVEGTGERIGINQKVHKEIVSRLFNGHGPIRVESDDESVFIES